MTNHDDRERPQTGEDRVDRPRDDNALDRTGKQAAKDIGLGTGDLGPGGAGAAGGGTATGIGSAAGDARPPHTEASTPGSHGTGGTGGRGPSGDVAGVGGPATPAGDTGGAEAGRGPGVAGDDQGTTGVFGMGSGATGHPQGATGGDVSGRPVEVNEADRRRGVIEQRETSVVGNVGAGREAGLPDSAGGSSQQAGKHGSGSTTAVPGGTVTPDPRGGSVGGTGALGAGGIAPSGSDFASSPIADRGAKGAGARGEEREEAEKAAHRGKPPGKDGA